MANRTGIELLPTVCRIVEIQSGGGLFGGKGRKAGRVRTFREIPYSPGSPGFLTAELRQIKGLERRATVAVWGLKSRHEAFLLPPAAASDLETMARREAKPAAQAADAVMVGELRDGGRREVGYVSVQPDELRSRLQPLVDAGLDIQRAVTPALAHAAVVQQRWASFPDAVTAVLSVNARATALTVLRGRIVLFAREMPWGHETERAEQAGAPLDANRFASMLASELRRSFVSLKQVHRVDVTHVLVCGDLPEPRALTGPLMNELGVEVETLDALEGLDLSSLPAAGDDFRSRLAALRTAWALATDTSVAVNLSRVQGRAASLAPKIERRHGLGLVAGILIAAAAWGLVTWLGRGAATEQDRLRREIALLDPELARLAEARRNSELVSARLAALRAFASQGPRIAKVLEVFSRSAPPEVAITDWSLEPSVGAWTLTVIGKAEGPNAAQAQLTFSRFLSSLKASPLLGDPLTAPAISVKNDDPLPEKPRNYADNRRRNLYEAELVEGTRPGWTGPTFIEVARNGRMYRIPVRQAAPNYLDEEEERRRRRRELDALERVALPDREPEETAGRRPGAVLEFTVKYEVRK